MGKCQVGTLSVNQGIIAILDYSHTILLATRHKRTHSVALTPASGYLPRSMGWQAELT